MGGKEESGGSVSVERMGEERGGSQRGLRRGELILSKRPPSSWGERQRGERPKHHERKGQESDRSHCSIARRGGKEELREGPITNLRRGNVSERPQSCLEMRLGRSSLGSVGRAGGWRPQPSRPNTAPPDGNAGLTLSEPAVSTPGNSRY